MSKLLFEKPKSVGSIGGPNSVSVADDISCISLGTAAPACEVKDMNADFLDHLLLAQKAYGRKFRINSAFRSVAWDKSKGRSGLSSHCKGLAVDIAAPTHRERLFIVASLLIMGFRRIGIAKSFIHVDDDPDKKPSLWLYDLEDLTKTF